IRCERRERGQETISGGRYQARPCRTIFTMPLDDPERYLVPSSRPPEIALGLVVGALSLLFVSFASYVLWWGIRHGLLKGPYDSGWLGYVSVPIALYVLGLPGSWVAFRLLSGRARRDGGLFSPAVLRLGGALLLLA